MKVYISGISGTGMGPLALMAHEAGCEVVGSDLARGAVYDELVDAGIEAQIGAQDGEFLRYELEQGLDWFVYTSALPEDHAELVMAREAGVRCTKRDDLTAFLVEALEMKMVAVAGTHGKTTTTAMTVWAAMQLGLPVSYIVGTTLGFAPAGAYHIGDDYFVYEADEYDRNFLKFYPWLAAVTCVSYDHPDIYPKERDYKGAFRQFEEQSEQVLRGEEADELEVEFRLAGAVRRADARLAMRIVLAMYADMTAQGKFVGEPNYEEIVEVLNRFPGVGRRFERVAAGVYTDYAHHPEEIAATVEIAREEAELTGRKGVVVVYQPHQNTRQYEVREGYREAFAGADKVYWLPTYLTRENPKLAVLTPEELMAEVSGVGSVEAAELDNALAGRLRQHLAEGDLVVLMTAGPADEWLREEFGA